MFSFFSNEIGIDLPTLVFSLVVFFSPFISILTHKQDYPQWFRVAASYKVKAPLYFGAILLGVAGSRFLILFFYLASLFVLTQAYEWNRFAASLFLVAVDLAIWGVLDKWKFLGKEPLAIKIIFIYLMEMFLMMGFSVAVAFLASLLI